jgi:hypothetical protein
MGSIKTSMEAVLCIKLKDPSMIINKIQQTQNKNKNTWTDNKSLLHKNLEDTTLLPNYCDMAKSQNSGIKKEKPAVAMKCHSNHVSTAIINMQQ